MRGRIRSQAQIRPKWLRAAEAFRRRIIGATGRLPGPRCRAAPVGTGWLPRHCDRVRFACTARSGCSGRGRLELVFRCGQRRRVGSGRRRCRVRRHRHMRWGHDDGRWLGRHRRLRSTGPRRSVLLLVLVLAGRDPREPSDRAEVDVLVDAIRRAASDREAAGDRRGDRAPLRDASAGRINRPRVQAGCLLAHVGDGAGEVPARRSRRVRQRCVRGGDRLADSMRDLVSDLRVRSGDGSGIVAATCSRHRSSRSHSAPHRGHVAMCVCARWMSRFEHRPNA